MIPTCSGLPEDVDASKIPASVSCRKVAQPLQPLCPGHSTRQWHSGTTHSTLFIHLWGSKLSTAEL